MLPKATMAAVPRGKYVRAAAVSGVFEFAAAC